MSDNVRVYKTGSQAITPKVKASLVVPLSEIRATMEYQPTGWGGFDSLCGGGLAAVHDPDHGDFNLLYLLGGIPGSGKSTMMLQLLSIAGQSELSFEDRDPNTGIIVEQGVIPKKPLSSLYCTTEENGAFIKTRVNRMGIPDNNILITESSFTEDVIDSTLDQAPDILVIDSIQKLRSKNVRGAPGGRVQLDYMEGALKAIKRAGITVILIGHSTKGTGELRFAGTQTLQHMVDVVMWMRKGIFNQNERILWFEKNRGGRNDIQLKFDLTENGFENEELEDRYSL